MEAEMKQPKRQCQTCKIKPETAHAIVNDIAEGIDNGESREVLRAALSYYADELASLSSKYANANLRLTCLQIAIQPEPRHTPRKKGAKR